MHEPPHADPPGTADPSGHDPLRDAAPNETFQAMWYDDGAVSEATESERQYAMFIHIAHFASVLLPVVLPLVLWLVKRDESDFIDDHGREAVNFEITMLIYSITAGVLLMCAVGAFLLPVVFVLWIIGIIMGSVAASRGKYYRYPMCLRLIRAD